jgi:hypothetical protein
MKLLCFVFAPTISLVANEKSGCEGIPLGYGGLLFSMSPYLVDPPFSKGMT